MHTLSPISRTQQLVTLLGVIVPLLGFAAAIASLWGRAVGWTELSLLVGMYLASGLGVTVGYHRLFVHRSFEACRPVRFALAVLGSMSVEGPLLRWAAIHRRHHQHSDDAADPHSPHHFGSGVGGVLSGWWHAHIGWMFRPNPSNLARYVRDLYADRMVRVASRLWMVWAAAGLAIPTAVGALCTGSWTGAFLGFIWGGLARIFLVHQITWSVNSVCHLWGSRPFHSGDESRNNFVCGLLALGEGWHNNHHAFPASARHGLRWWEFDISYAFIRILEVLGLAWRVRVPLPGHVAERRTMAQSFGLQSP